MLNTKRLLQWFARARRDLPWRREPRDPYRVFISEVMLQQTRVEVVIPYYRRFLRRFPTLRSLADAPVDEVLALWSGLGYYARARNLHRAAQMARAGLPRTSAELRNLPGFGPYTSAAVASLAFGEDVPLVDGNVARVLSRVYRLRGDARAQAWTKAARILPRGRAGEFNEALMELGATICLPRSPRCDRCPIAIGCGGRLEPEKFPPPRAARIRPVLEWNAVALRRSDGAVLLARRPEGSLFAGMWDLPDAPPAGVRLRGPARSCGLVEQTLTHREVRVAVSSAAASGNPLDANARWVEVDGLAQLGLSSLARKSLRQAGVLTSHVPSRNAS